MTKVLVVGLGGVGVIAAYTLQQNGCEVAAVIRSDYELVKDRGYEIESADFGHVDSWRPTHFVKTAKEAADQFGPFDYIVLTVKNIPDVSNVEDTYADAVSKDTVILLLENGYGIEKAAFERFPGNIILSGVSMISSANHAGKIDQNGEDSLAVGYFDNGVKSKEEHIAKVEEFVALYKYDKNVCFIDPDVKYTRWRKLIYNATFNTIGAILNLDVGRLGEFGGFDALIIPAMDEVITLAAADGVTLDPELKDVMIHSDDGHWYAPSMVVDVRKGNQVEVEVILGNALRFGKEKGVHTPVLNIVYEMLKLVQMRLKEQNGRIKLPEVRPVKDAEAAKQSRQGYI